VGSCVANYACELKQGIVGTILVGAAFSKVYVECELLMLGFEIGSG
jgi:hypothetical protein